MYDYPRPAVPPAPHPIEKYNDGTYRSVDGSGRVVACAPRTRRYRMFVDGYNVMSGNVTQIREFLATYNLDEVVAAHKDEVYAEVGKRNPMGIAWSRERADDSRRLGDLEAQEFQAVYGYGPAVPAAEMRAARQKCLLNDNAISAEFLANFENSDIGKLLGGML